MVDDPIKVNIETSDTLCYGLEGFAKAIIVDSSSEYQIIWKTNPEQEGESITGPAGDRYQVIITKLNSSCKLDTLVKIPNFKNMMIAGFFEEFLYRGFFFGVLFYFAGWGFIPAIILPSIYFGIGHLYQAESLNESISSRRSKAEKD